ncbi:MAG: hypothetical protein NC084_13240 [Bacteroides sp.]|nr:hypothetical protein [Eubacterium sp.]MCM1419307.1 hypothetical protein [Roseburia sp.]MCM1463661.1 hypothetical protein [Bacteroides sp.]
MSRKRDSRREAATTKYYLKIDGYEVPNITSLVVSEFYRNETQTVTLSGGLAVDRGASKLKVYVRLRSAGLEKIKALEEKISGITAEAEFYYRGERVIRQMIASPISGYDVSYPERTEENPYYEWVTFELEEQ